MARNRLFPAVPIKTLPRSFVAFDKEFAFDAGKTGDRERALSQAETHGNAVLQAFEKRVGRPLSVKETLTLKQDVPPPEPYSGSLRKTSPVTNPYRDRMAEISKWSEMHEFQRQRKIRRLEALQKSADEWDAKQAGIEQLAGVKAGPDYQRALALVSARLGTLLLDGSAEQSAIESCQLLQGQLESGAVSPGAVFQALTVKQPLPSPGGSTNA